MASASLRINYWVPSWREHGFPPIGTDVILPREKPYMIQSPFSSVGNRWERSVAILSQGASSQAVCHTEHQVQAASRASGSAHSQLQTGVVIVTGPRNRLLKQLFWQLVRNASPHFKLLVIAMTVYYVGSQTDWGAL